jgi:hypothetical protein
MAIADQVIEQPLRFCLGQTRPPAWTPQLASTPPAFRLYAGPHKTLQKRSVTILRSASLMRCRSRVGLKNARSSVGGGRS